MKVKRETRKWGRVIKMVAGLLFIGIFSGLIYYMFEPTMKADAVYPALMTALFLLLCGVAILAFWGKEYTKLALDRAFYKNGFFTVLVDAAGRAILDFGPPTRSFKIETKDEKLPDLELRLGPTSTFVGNSPVFFGTDASIFNIDIVNVIHRRLTEFYKISSNFSGELLLALERSKRDDPSKYFELDNKGRVARDPLGKPIWKNESTPEIQELKELMRLDLNKIFPLTSMSVDFQGMLMAYFNGGVRVGQIRSFEELLNNRKVQMVGGAVLIITFLAGALAFQTYTVLNEDVIPKIDGVQQGITATYKEVEAVKAQLDQKGSNLDLLPGILTESSKEGDAS